MPRDDLTIDFVRRMPQPETVDPDQILNDFFYRYQNIPEEIRFINAEIEEKDREVNSCQRIIEDRDAKIQRWIKTNGSHVPNPREETLRNTIRENYVKMERLSDEKIALSSRLLEINDRQLLLLDRQIKGLYDRAEPGFNDPDDVPSLLRSSAANIPAPSFRTTNGTNGARATPSTPANGPRTSTVPALNKLATAQIRNSQAQQHAASAPATPAANGTLNRTARESSAGPGSGAPKRGPRSAAALGTTPNNPSGLARHSSLGPGPSKSGPMTGGGSAVRAGSAGPRTSTTKGSTAGGSRKGTPGATARKKPPPKSSLFRVKKASSKASPASAESDLSDADSASLSGDDKRGRSRGASGTPARGDGGATASINVTEGSRGPGGARRRAAQGEDHEMADAEDEEAGDDRKYCFCRTVSFGDMVACDNEDCPYEWFHWSCVGLKSEPNGKWFCAECGKKEKK